MERDHHTRGRRRWRRPPPLQYNSHRHLSYFVASSWRYCEPLPGPCRQPGPHWRLLAPNCLAGRTSPVGPLSGLYNVMLRDGCTPECESSRGRAVGSGAAGLVRSSAVWAGLGASQVAVVCVYCVYCAPPCSPPIMQNMRSSGQRGQPQQRFGHPLDRRRLGASALAAPAR